MDLFVLGRTLHSAVGCIALATFWIAALSAKGGPNHRRAGKIYLLSLVGVMSLSTLMVAGKVAHGDVGSAVFFVFLISMVGTASWLTWFSIRRRRDPARLTGLAYRSLATWLIVAGAAVLTLGVARAFPLAIFLSLLGLGFGANMWRLALRPDRGERFWLAHHMNGAMLNFMATHDSFLALGVGSIVPELRHPVPRMLVAVVVVGTGLLLRAWQGRLQRRGVARIAA